jgi:hypothetical protein
VPQASFNYIGTFTVCLELLQSVLDRVFNGTTSIEKGPTETREDGVTKVLRTLNQLLVTMSVYLMGPLDLERTRLSPSLYAAIEQTLLIMLRLEDKEKSAAFADLGPDAALQLLETVDSSCHLLRTLMDGDDESRMMNAVQLSQSVLPLLGAVQDALLTHMQYFDQDANSNTYRWHTGPCVLRVYHRIDNSQRLYLFKYLLDIYCSLLSIASTVHFQASNDESYGKYTRAFSVQNEAYRGKIFAKYICGIEVMRRNRLEKVFFRMPQLCLDHWNQEQVQQVRDSAHPSHICAGTGL